MSNLILLLWLGLMAGALYIAFSVIAKVYKLDHKQRSKRFFKQAKNNKTQQRITRSSYNNPFLAGAWHQLLTRVNFDVATAERLINHLKRKHPGKTDRWYIEKAINDLDRDRN